MIKILYRSSDYTIKCDNKECFESRTLFAFDAIDAFKKFKADGWTKKQGKHYCKECSKKTDD